MLWFVSVFSMIWAIGPILSSSRNVCLCVCLRRQMHFFSLSLALRSHDQFPVLSLVNPVLHDPLSLPPCPPANMQKLFL